MKHASTATLLCALLTVAGCAPQTIKYTIAERFNEEETKAKMQPGNNTIKGSALIRQVGGGTVTCAGLPVAIGPVTAYATERMIVIYGNDQAGYNSAGIDRRNVEFDSTPEAYLRYSRREQCDSQGYFAFKNVGDGDYFVITSIVWDVPNNIFKQGGNIFRKVSVHGGEVAEVVLAP